VQRLSPRKKEPSTDAELPAAVATDADMTSPAAMSGGPCVGLIGPGDLDDDDPDQQLMKLLLQQGSKWTCKACGRVGNRRDNMKRHVENVHLPRVLRCKLCQMLVRNRQTFYRHMKHKHGITSMRETEQYKEDPCDPDATGMRDPQGNPVGSYDDDLGDDDTPGSEHFMMSLLKVEHAE
jgi:uncharacterized C2H2 Zn-finger protein